METVKEFCPADRYTYDFGLCSIKNGFAQIDTGQDASYFGIWANPTKRIIFSYIEGDCITQIADNDAEFTAEIRKMKQWYDESGHRFVGIDAGCNDDLEARFKALGLEDLLH